MRIATFSVFLRHHHRHPNNAAVLIKESVVVRNIKTKTVVSSRLVWTLYLTTSHSNHHEKKNVDREKEILLTYYYKVQGPRLGQITTTTTKTTATSCSVVATIKSTIIWSAKYICNDFVV